jgi:hypothetical protein
MTATVYQHLTNADALAAWEPIDGHALVTCKIHNGGAWENRTYEFDRCQDGWIIDTTPGYLKRASWQEAVDWFCRMRPSEIELLTTV